jgi:lanosterol synthase
VSDTTAEALKAVLELQPRHKTAQDNIHNKVADRRLWDAVDILLAMQNPTGGFASYEKIRGSGFFEWFNTSEVYGALSLLCHTLTLTSTLVTHR